MEANLDYISPADREKILKISKEKKLYLYQIGQMCEVKDKAYWSRIMNNKKPVPEHVRAAITNMFRKENLL